MAKAQWRMHEGLVLGFLIAVWLGLFVMGISIPAARHIAGLYTADRPLLSKLGDAILIFCSSVVSNGPLMCWILSYLGAAYKNQLAIEDKAARQPVVAAVTADELGAGIANPASPPAAHHSESHIRKGLPPFIAGLPGLLAFLAAAAGQILFSEKKLEDFTDTPGGYFRIMVVASLLSLLLSLRRTAFDALLNRIHKETVSKDEETPVRSKNHRG